MPLRGAFFVGLEAEILVFDVGLAEVIGVVGELKRSNTGWKDTVKEGERLGAVLNSGDWAKDNFFIKWTSDVGAGIVREEEFAGGD